MEKIKNTLTITSFSIIKNEEIEKFLTNLYSNENSEIIQKYENDNLITVIDDTEHIYYYNKEYIYCKFNKYYFTYFNTSKISYKPDFIKTYNKFLRKKKIKDILI
jgi:hypothetical protein